MKKQTRIILDLLNKAYPNAKCELEYNSPFQLLIATVLSAQTTDKKVNEVTKKLFADYPDLESFSMLTTEILENYIKKLGLYRNKSKNIVSMVKQLNEDFNGKVPNTIEGIIKLKGAGRKTANVVVSNAFGIQAIAVDTHVFRVSNRIGLASSSNVLEVEKTLQKEIPQDEWTKTHHLLIFHGRRCCTARNPRCFECIIAEYCNFYCNLNIK